MKLLLPVLVALLFLGGVLYFRGVQPSHVTPDVEQTTVVRAPPSNIEIDAPAEPEVPAVPETSGPTLDLSNRGLTGVPQDVFSRTELTALDLSHNALSGALPGEVRHLSALERLDLSHNKFTGVPAEVGQIASLRYLDLSYNEITGLPYELGNLHNLEVLDLTGNSYSHADLAKIKETLPSGVQIIGG